MAEKEAHFFYVILSNMKNKPEVCPCMLQALLSLVKHEYWHSI